MISIKSAGGYDKLEFEELKDGEPVRGANYKKGETSDDYAVTVNVHAIGVNYGDVVIRWGLYKTAKDLVGWPITPGFEFSGTVAAIGPNVSGFKVGDSVLGLTLFGAYAEKVVVLEHQLVHVPSQMTLSEAGGFLTVAMTAWYAIIELCKLRPGDKILVHSAAGGVGSMLVQIGKILQCYVVGVIGSSHKKEYALATGCDVVIDKSCENLWEKADEYADHKGYKAIFDANGVETVKKSFYALATGGRLVVYGLHSMLPKSTVSGTGYLSVMDWIHLGASYMRIPQFNPSELITDNKSVLGFNLSTCLDETELFKEAWAQMLPWIEEGKLKVPQVKEYCIVDVGEAHRELESGKTTGKLVLLSRQAWAARSMNKLQLDEKTT